MSDLRNGPRRKRQSHSGQPSSAAKPGKSRRVTKPAKAQLKRRKQSSEGREAAYERLVSDELCVKLAGRFARDSAKATGDDTATVRLHYDKILIELRCLRETQSGGERRSLSDV